jgi:hypothetical protein
MTTQKRIHAGIPTGGQFSDNDRAEGTISLRPHAHESPADVDTQLAAHHLQAETLRFHIARGKATVEKYSEIDSDRARMEIDRAERFIAGLREELDPVDVKIEQLQSEFVFRGGWSRFYLVSNAGGHVHSSTHCSTCFPTTRFGWLTDMSGKDEAGVVDDAGDSACTVCFPSAPVADPNKPRANKLELPEKRAAREERQRKSAESAAKKEAASIANPDGTVLMAASYLRHDGTEVRGYAIHSARTAEIEAVSEMVTRRWRVEYAKNRGEPDTVQSRELDGDKKKLSDDFINRAVAALAAKRGETEDEVRAVIVKKATAKLKKEGLAL